jgi:hypothetical protein
MYVHYRRSHKGPDSEWRYSSALSLTSLIDVVVVISTTPPIYPLERPGTPCIGGWVWLQGRCGQVRKISPPTGIRSPDRPASSESIFRLSYRGAQLFINTIRKLHINHAFKTKCDWFMIGNQ